MTTDRGTVRIVVAGLLGLAITVAVGLLLLVAVGDLDGETKRYALTTAGGMGTVALGAGAAVLATTKSIPAAEEPAPIDDLLPPPA